MRTPLWHGPYKDGITFSLLCKFIVCRHRFWIKVIEGLGEPDILNEAMEYGNFWHEAEEKFSRKDDWTKAIAKYRDRLVARYPGMEKEIWQLYHICRIQYPLYIQWWEKHSVEITRKPLVEEVSFCVPYTLPSGRVILLRGKYDCIYTDMIKMTLQENKSKTRVDEDGITWTLRQNLQVMIYQVSIRAAVRFYHKLSTEQKRLLAPVIDQIRKGVKPTESMYNVIKRPLGDIYSIKRRQGERDSEFYDVRLHANIRDNPKKYFHRWVVDVTEEHVDEFRSKILDPQLEMLCDWWDSIQGNLFDPWNIWKEGEVVGRNMNHYQAPWGVYNSMWEGFRGDYFEYLAQGRKSGMRRVKTLYPELAEAVNDSSTRS